MTVSAQRRRSVAFVDLREERWACFLATAQAEDGTWRGSFIFRPGSSELTDDEVRTTDIFVEGSEADVCAKARGLGRPLLRSLLESALHAASREGGGTPRLRGQFRDLLTANAHDIAGSWWNDEHPIGEEAGIDRLRSLYTSYRLDQVSHLICLIDPGDFEDAVDQILGGAVADFRSKDRLQYAMMVVDHIEALLPLPDFETWARDYLANPEAYRLYTHTLHRERRLP